MFVPSTPFVYAQDTGFDVKAEAAIAIDATSGKIFYEKNADTPLPIASMTKLLSIYLILDAIEKETITWDQQIKISKHLADLSQNVNLSNVFLYEGHSYSVKDLFTATEKVSANAATVALAESISVTEKDFIDDMRAKLKEWDITDAYIISTSGINNSDAMGQTYPGSLKDEENLMSASDVAQVAFHLLNDFPEILEYTSKTSAVFGQGTEFETVLTSTNQMLPGSDYFKTGVDGLKTGTTDLAGTCFTGTIEKDGRRVITVVMNVQSVKNDTGARFIETSRLMDYALNSWSYETVYQKNSPLPTFGKVTLVKGTSETIDFKLKEDVAFWVNSADSKAVAITFEPNSDFTNSDGKLQAPIKVDDNIGTFTISFPDNSLDTIFLKKNTLTVPAYADEEVEKSSWIHSMLQKAELFLSRLFKT